MKKICIWLLLFCLFLVSCADESYPAPKEQSSMPETSYTKVFLLLGQSNADGVSRNACLADTISEEKYATYANGFDSVLISYSLDHAAHTSDGFVPVRVGQGCTQDYFGPELGFAEEITRLSDETVYIIKIAFGGTQLDSQWLDGNGQRGELYNESVNFIRAEMAKLQNAKIVGTMWMQGESDGAVFVADRYYENTKSFVSFLRKDLAEYIPENGMIFADAGIADNWSFYSTVNRGKARFAADSALNVYFETTENGLHNNLEPAENIDRAHYDSASEILLGKWFADAIIGKMTELGY